MEKPALVRKMQWFSWGVTLGLFLVCNVLLLGGWWVSGVDLEAALSKPELFDPLNGHCVGVAWSKVEGVEGLIKVCTEWLDFSDMSGVTHRLPPGKAIAMGGDGNLYFPGQAGENYRLIGLVIFVIVIVALGMWLKRFLISKYHSYLQATDQHTV